MATCALLTLAVVCDLGLMASRTAVGTPDYISPEILTSMEGRGKYGTECDWWSFGVVIYEDLIRSLLCETGKRLGQKGLEDFKGHPFFKGVDWEALQTGPAPYMPQLVGATDTSNFDEVDVKSDIVARPSQPKQFSGQHLPFVGYTFSRETPTVALRNRRNSVLVNRASKLEAQVRELQDKLHSAQHSDTTNNLNGSAAAVDLEALKTRISKLEADVQRRSAENESLEATVSELERKNRVSQRQQAELEAELEEVNKHGTTLTAQLGTLRRNVAELENELDLATTRETALRADEAQLRRRVSVKEDEVSELEAQLQAQLGLIQTLRSEKASLESELHGLRAQSNSGSSTDLTAAYEELQHKSDLQVASLQERVAALEEELRRSQRDVRLAGEDKVAVQHDLEQQRREVERLQSSTSTLLEARTALQERLDQAERAAAEAVDALQRETEALQSSLHDMSEQHEHALQRIDELQSRDAGSEAQQDLIAALTTECEELRTRLEELDATNAARADEIAQLAAGTQLSSEAEALIEQLEAQLDEHRVEQQSLLAKIHELQLQVEELKQLHSSPEAAFERMQWQLRRTQKVDRQEIRTLQQDLAAQNQAKVDAEQRVQVLSAQVAALQADMTERDREGQLAQLLQSASGEKERFSPRKMSGHSLETGSTVSRESANSLRPGLTFTGILDAGKNPSGTSLAGLDDDEVEVAPFQCDLKIPKPGGIKKGWTRAYVYARQGTLYVYEYDSNPTREVPDLPEPLKPVNPGLPTLQSHPRCMVDLIRQQLRIRPAEEDDVIHANAKDLPRIFLLEAPGGDPTTPLRFFFMAGSAEQQATRILQLTQYIKAVNCDVPEAVAIHCVVANLKSVTCAARLDDRSLLAVSNDGLVVAKENGVERIFTDKRFQHATQILCLEKPAFATAIVYGKTPQVRYFHNIVQSIRKRDYGTKLPETRGCSLATLATFAGLPILAVAKQNKILVFTFTEHGEYNLQNSLDIERAVNFLRFMRDQLIVGFGQTFVSFDLRSANSSRTRQALLSTGFSELSFAFPPLSTLVELRPMAAFCISATGTGDEEVVEYLLCFNRCAVFVNQLGIPVHARPTLKWRSEPQAFDVIGNCLTVVSAAGLEVLSLATGALVEVHWLPDCQLLSSQHLLLLVTTQGHIMQGYSPKEDSPLVFDTRQPQEGLRRGGSLRSLGSRRLTLARRGSRASNDRLSTSLISNPSNFVHVGTHDANMTAEQMARAAASFSQVSSASTSAASSQQSSAVPSPQKRLSVPAASQLTPSPTGPIRSHTISATRRARAVDASMESPRTPIQSTMTASPGRDVSTVRRATTSSTGIGAGARRLPDLTPTNGPHPTAAQRRVPMTRRQAPAVRDSFAVFAEAIKSAPSDDLDDVAARVAAVSGGSSRVTSQSVESSSEA
ncbi:uncharacterized protein MONBRDRAFT_22890 [Monosiga brevicollis MX1]|uniref:non-specific serine/threonine protein kinase n=1 Tax=Monosiga brevicollis TaxID=81824 RepID=A9USD4_MONBE|nr:uncharacterized protein MONBRDRAFT_22890 [Monosiga brevicollis MX1]EDQ92081.1 predicted protein [Monosiga brevicollis MX1]|eukprot:XP_001743367.1 hypothetical protein [Monosiga brevicollis MX1]